LPVSRADRRRRSSTVRAIILTAALCGLTAGAAGSNMVASPPSPDAAAGLAEPPGPADVPAYHYCPVCGARNRIENRFCMKDGTPLPPILPQRWVPGFVRSPGTFSPEEIQQVMHRVAQSVVRIRVHTTSTYKYPVTYWKDEEDEYYGRAMLGRIETSDSDLRLAGSGFVIGAGGEIVTNAHVASPDGQEATLAVET
jgi:S1-C subfamily serine protease